MRGCIVAALLAAFAGASAADGATKAECRSACTAFVAACRTDDCSTLARKKGRRCAKRCKKQSERRCRSAGVAACALPDPPDPPTPPASKYYSAVDLGTLGGVGSNAVALNDDGDVVGSSETEGTVVRAFIWSAGVMKAIGTFGGRDSYGLAVNNLKHVAGVASDSVYGFSPFLHHDGMMTRVADFPYPPGERMSLNDSDRVVGYYGNSIFFVSPPISPPATPEIWSIEDVNQASLMAGSIYQDGVPNAARFTADGVATVLGTLAGPEYPVAFSYGKAINDQGDVVGTSDTDLFVLHAFLYAEGTMIDLGTLHGVLGETSVATDINDAGQILGWSGQEPYYQPLPGLKTEYFLYEHGTMRSVGSLIDPALGWTVASAGAINARGQIAATAYTGSPKPHAVLLTPPQ